MKLTATLPGASAALLLVLLAPPAARAQTSTPLTLTLTPAAQAGTAPATFHFSGMLTNPTASEVFLNGDSLSFNGPADGLTLDDSPFLNNAPLSLGASGSGTDTFTGGLFDVSASNLAAPGTYFGTFTILGGPTGNDQNTVATQDFSVTINSPAPVPEPSSAVSLGVLLALCAGRLWWTRQRKPLAFEPPAL